MLSPPALDENSSILISIAECLEELFYYPQTRYIATQTLFILFDQTNKKLNDQRRQISHMEMKESGRDVEEGPAV